MKKVITKNVIFIVIFMFVLLLFSNIAFAGDINPDDYKHNLVYSDAYDIFNKGAVIIKLLRNIAAVISVVTLSIIGVRYMLGSVEQKAEYKQTMMPVVVGCVLVASLSAILTIIQSIV